MVKKLDFVRGAFSSLLNSPKYQKSSHFSKNGNKKAFSVAEAMIALLIGSLALGAAAPMITKQLKQNNLNDTQFTILEKRMVPKGAVMFFNLAKCPTGWHPIATSSNSLDGHYLRIAKEKSSEIGTTKEQMVHKHKHVSPFMAFYGAPMMNQHRYGPYNFPGRMWISTFNQNVNGDSAYPEIKDVYYDGGNYLPSGYQLMNTPLAFYGVGYPQGWHYNTVTYTSDGVNRTEQLFGIKNSSEMTIKNLTVCPNRDEDDAVCKPSGNNYDIPYLSEMPLVGDENRPNSLVLLACEKD